jgi:hypothetical protein
VNFAQNARQKRDAVSNGEQADVENDVLAPVKEEDHAQQER